MISIRIDVDLEPFLKQMESLKAASQNLQPVMERASTMMLESAQRNFNAESARTPKAGHVAPSGFWADLKESTKKQRAAEGTWPGKKLQRTGRLLASLEKSATNSAAQIGTNVRYGKHLQYGTVKMAARPFLALQKEDAEIIMRTVQEHFEKNLKSS